MPLIIGHKLYVWTCHSSLDINKMCGHATHHRIQTRCVDMPLIIEYKQDVRTCHTSLDTDTMCGHATQYINHRKYRQRQSLKQLIQILAYGWSLANGMLTHFHTSYPTVFNGWKFQIRVMCSTVVLLCDTDSYWISIQAMLCFNVITLCYNRPAIVYINHGRTKILVSYGKKCLSL
jgi:hypothetical protein